MKAIDRYITLADEVISLYETYQVRNYTIQGIEYIKQLQRDVQTFTPQDIESNRRLPRRCNASKTAGFCRDET